MIAGNVVKMRNATHNRQFNNSNKNLQKSFSEFNSHSFAMGRKFRSIH